MSEFEKQCRQVADTTGIECDGPFLEDKISLDAFEDDTFLHVQKGNVRMAFGVGGDHITPKSQNERTKQVLTALGLQKLIADRVLVEEYNEEENTCPHCGRSY